MVAEVKGGTLTVKIKLGKMENYAKYNVYVIGKIRNIFREEHYDRFAFSGRSRHS